MLSAVILFAHVSLQLCLTRGDYPIIEVYFKSVEFPGFYTINVIESLHSCTVSPILCYLEIIDPFKMSFILLFSGFNALFKQYYSYITAEVHVFMVKFRINQHKTKECTLP